MKPTREQILEANGGQLNEWVMEHVMGWTRDIDQDGDMWGWIGEGAPWGADAPFEPSTDPRAAAEVLTKFTERDDQRRLLEELDAIMRIMPEAGFWIRWNYLTAEPADVCRAALLAGGGWNEAGD